MSAGRPRTEPDDRVTTNVRFPRDLHSRLVDAAAERQVSANLLMTVAIRELLERLLPVDEIVWTRRDDRPSSLRADGTNAMDGFGPSYPGAEADR